MKRVLSIQDISCIGKCSLTVALPIISAMGVETSIVPTAVLSTHTQFNNFTFRDLTEDMEPIMEHWLKEDFQFDGIYTGYLGSERQIQIVSDYFDTFKTSSNYIIVDPAMADNGKMYTGFDLHFAKKMASLCNKADIILPNISEAAFMLGKEYPGEEADIETLKEMLLELATLGSKIVVITGVTFDENKFGFIGYDTKTNEFFEYATEKINYKSHGTGDVFASTFTGALMRNFPVKEALRIAADFTCACIKNNYENPGSVNYAVNFEAEIPYLLSLIS